MGVRLEIEGVRLEIDGVRLAIEGVRLAIEGARLAIEGARLEIEGARLEIEGARLAIEGARLEIEGVRLEIEGVRLAIEGVRLAIEGVRLAIEGVRLAIEGVGPEMVLDDTSLTLCLGPPLAPTRHVRRPRLYGEPRDGPSSQQHTPNEYPEVSASSGAMRKRAGGDTKRTASGALSRLCRAAPWQRYGDAGGSDVQKLHMPCVVMWVVASSAGLCCGLMPVVVQKITG